VPEIKVEFQFLPRETTENHENLQPWLVGVQVEIQTGLLQYTCQILLFELVLWLSSVI
jgi:hypothetical protein